MWHAEIGEALPAAVAGNDAEALSMANTPRFVAVGRTVRRNRKKDRRTEMAESAKALIMFDLRESNSG